MPLAYDGHKVSAHHKFANGTYFISSALVLKFSAFFLIKKVVYADKASFELGIFQAHL